MKRPGYVLWPHRSPDLTPFDYVSWMYLKYIEYRKASTKIPELKTKMA